VEQVLVQSASTDGSTYLNSNRQTLQYDAQGRAQLLTIESWQNNAWQNYSLTTYTYDALGNPTMATMQAWNGSSYQNYQRLLLTYLQVTSTTPRALAAGLSVAPNPAAGAATVRYTLPAAGRATVQVLDLTGRRVATVLADAPQAAGAHSLPLPATNLAAGLYLVQLQVGNQREQVKLLVP
jgi:hypothetical protein